ncbi:hypothetical protein M8818_004566 [Zalaria obscura]|uniref:Uncharacterized protein n=1 Tax=Zalaria obscura TaxID=2024903 RepID=A0ACC3SCF1_9PEZI
MLGIEEVSSLIGDGLRPAERPDPVEEEWPPRPGRLCFCSSRAWTAAFSLAISASVGALLGKAAVWGSLEGAAGKKAGTISSRSPEPAAVRVGVYLPDRQDMVRTRERRRLGHGWPMDVRTGTVSDARHCVQMSVVLFAGAGRAWVLGARC